MSGTPKPDRSGALLPEVRALCEELVRIKHSKGLSLDALAHASVGYSRSSWARVLRGQAFPPRDAVAALAERHRLNAEHLLGLWDEADAARLRAATADSLIADTDTEAGAGADAPDAEGPDAYEPPEHDDDEEAATAAPATASEGRPVPDDTAPASPPPPPLGPSGDSDTEAGEQGVATSGPDSRPVVATTSDTVSERPTPDLAENADSSGDSRDSQTSGEPSQRRAAALFGRKKVRWGLVAAAVLALVLGTGYQFVEMGSENPTKNKAAGEDNSKTPTPSPTVTSSPEKSQESSPSPSSSRSPSTPKGSEDEPTQQPTPDPSLSADWGFGSIPTSGPWARAPRPHVEGGLEGRKNCNYIERHEEKKLKKGASGQAVKQVQCLLNYNYDYGLNVDGQFGPATEDAVLGMQRCSEIKSDGVVEYTTWFRLGSPNGKCDS